MSDNSQTIKHKKYPACVECGETKKDPGYHWCYPCFRKWEEKNNGVKVATKCLIVEDSWMGSKEYQKEEADKAYHEWLNRNDE